jgi:hypothetical protein
VESFFGIPLPKDPPVNYETYEHKVLMCLGMMSIDLPRIQSRVGDKGGIGLIIGMSAELFLSRKLVG